MDQLKPQWRFELDNTTKKYKVHVHTIGMGDVDDPEIYLEQALYKWQQTEKGKWVIENSSPDPSYHQHVDHYSYGYTYYIVAYLNEKDYTYYRLKFE